MRILVTGAAGFIGFHVARRLLERGEHVIGLDNLNPYYDVSLKQARRALLEEHRNFGFAKVDLADAGTMEEIFRGARFDAIVHLAAQAGVRYSVENPRAYVDSNIVGFLNLLEGVRHRGTGHLVFASTSSVYGLNARLPFVEDGDTDHPASLYAATKKANEAMAHSYAHLFAIPCTGLRFFTVYGPWGRPDMALFKFTQGILAGEPIPVFNEGRMVRDFTYVDDIVEGVIRTMDRPAQADPNWKPESPRASTSRASWQLFNIGNHSRVELMRYIEALESALGMKAKLQLLPMQAGDIQATEADTSALEQYTGFRPSTPVEEGIRRFVAWYREYYGR
ncbi:MAG TPA: NAD-dependent epimerase [Usitatibacter sp.]|nr:NAD-dependent epimerase [Usitatibacter sp.]